ncbi:MAG TPA: c-type cytochrome [Burkholderiales bacterium]
MAAAAALLLAAGCGREAPAPAAPGATAAAGDTHERGRRIYNFRCYYCHGYSGDARTLAATYLVPAPRNFTATDSAALPRERMLDSVASGRPGTAMQGFSKVLSPEDVALVVDFVRREFVEARARNTRYHTAENGWPDHERHAAAFPFALGELPLDTPWEKLTPEQQAGKRLFLRTCITCHDRARVNDEGSHWDARPLSYPRNQYVPGQPVDATASASPYALHDIPPKLEGLTARERRGEKIFQDNCAFCHAADGTGRNWIGSFLAPHPRDLTNPANMATMTRERLSGVIRDGLPGTSMPGWKSVLAPEEIEAVIDYVARAFHPLAGAPVTDAKKPR